MKKNRNKHYADTKEKVVIDLSYITMHVKLAEKSFHSHLNIVLWILRLSLSAHGALQLQMQSIGAGFTASILAYQQQYGVKSSTILNVSDVSFRLAMNTSILS